jgi:hypothetical protein
VEPHHTLCYVFCIVHVQYFQLLSFFYLKEKKTLYDITFLKAHDYAIAMHLVGIQNICTAF